MAVYTQLTLEEVSELLRCFGLGSARALHGIAAGSVNTNYFVDTDDARYFLRFSEVATDDELRYEAALLHHLSKAGLPTPELLRTSDTGITFVPLRTRHASLFRFVAGTERSELSATPKDMEKLGAAMGRLHAATLDFAIRRPHTFELDSLRRWIGELVALGSNELRAAVVLLQEELEWRDGAGTRREGLPRGVIHGDLFPDNVKWSDDGEIALLYDFEPASDGVLVYDLAVMLNAWCWAGAAFDNAKMRAFVRGYERARPLTLDEKAAIYGEARQSALRFMVTRIKDFHLRPMPTGARVEKDFRDYQRRLEVLRAQGAQGFAESIF